MRWMWIDRIVELVPRERLVAVKAVSLSEEHLHDHFPADEHDHALPIMPASLVLEGMAQSAGILVGHAADFRHKVILAKINSAEFTADAAPGSTLRYTARLDRFDDIGASCSGLIELLPHTTASPAFEPIARVELMFSHIDNNLSGLEFPDHNFVFTDSFRTLLRSSGLDAAF